MRIEVLVGSEDPIIFPLRNSKVVIGSGESCDVTLDASGISRKHITVVTEGDQYFVIDQGSTNGSFINEERLIPGKKVEFTSFFPVRLGDNVLLSLISDEESMDFHIPVPGEKSSPNISIPREREDSTTVIKINDLKKVRTEKLVLERNQKREIRKKVSSNVKAPEKKQDKKKIGVIQFSAVMLLLVAGYFNFIHLNENESIEPVHEIGKVVAVEKIEKNDEAIHKIPKDELPAKDSFNNLLNDMKCVTEVEKYICESVPGAKGGLFGASQVGLTIKVLLDGSHYIDEARKIVKTPKDETPEALMNYKKLLSKTAAFIFVLRGMPTLDETLLSENKLAIAFFVNKDGNPELDSVLAFSPKVFNQQKSKLKESDLFLIKNYGESALTNFDKYFTVY